MKDPYLVLGIGKNATDEEVKAAYHELARKYHPDNYTEDNPLKDLAKEKMQEVNEAYDKITKERSRRKKSSSSSSYTDTNYGSNEFYIHVRTLINERKFNDAELELSKVPQNDRVAEWHYLASVLLMQRNRINDAMRELEMACDMDPGNEEYQRAKEMFNRNANNFSNNYYANNSPYGQSGQYRRSSASSACDCCANLICLDCLCECMGGDLIRCI